MSTLSSLPPAFQSLPGVSGPAAAATTVTDAQAAPAAPQAAVYDGSGASAQSAYRGETRRLQFEADLAGNAPMAQGLRENGLPTDPRGLSDVVARANRCPREFAAVVEAARDVAVSLGKNPAAIETYKASFVAFTHAAQLPRNETGDLTYLVSRLAAAQVNDDQDAVRQRLASQMQDNLKLLDTLRRYEQSLENKLREAEAAGESKVDVVESDFRLTADGNVERVAEAEPEGEVKGDGTGITAEEGAKVDGIDVPVSASQPPTLRTMSLEQLANELDETRRQIRAIERGTTAVDAQSRRPQPAPSPVQLTGVFAMAARDVMGAD